MADVWGNFHWLRPAWLWALLPFVLFALTLFFRGRTASPWAKAVAPHLLRHLKGDSPFKAVFGPEALLSLLGVIAVLAAAGPTFRPQPNTGDPSKSPLVIVMDLSRSMAAKDVRPSRAARARLALLDLVQSRPGSPTALVVVAGSAHVLMPFTDDPAVLAPYLNALAPDLMPSDGKAYQQAAKLVGDLARQVKDPLSVLVVTDGVPPSGVAAFDELHQKHGLGVVVLAVGDSGDATVGAPALDNASLERLIDRTDGTLIELSFGPRDTGRILAALALNAAKTLDRRDARFWEDSGYLLVIPLALGVVLWFRRGFALGPTLALSVLSFCSGCSNHVADIWLTPDQQGRLLFEQGRYAEAAERFQDPMWKGLSCYAQGKFVDAAASFAALETKQGLYNLGNAYAQGGKLAAALHAYNRALTLSPTFRQARHNADLMRELIAAQQEDTDKDDFNQDPNQGPNDDQTQVSKDQLAGMQPPSPPKPGEDPSGPEEGTLSPAEEAAWLRHAESDPKDFLKRKLSFLASRSGTP